MQGNSRGTNCGIGRGGICLALVVIMALLSLCVQPSGEAGPEDTTPAMTITGLPQSTGDQTPGPASPTPIPPETPGNGGSAASTMPNRIRAYFSSVYTPASGSYPLDLNVIDSVWLREKVYGSLPVETCAHFTSPGVKKTFIFWNDTAYPMPGEFNRFVRESDVRVSTPADARGIADLYVKVWEPATGAGRAPVIVLESSADIPHVRNPVPGEIALQIQGPDVSRAGEDFRVRIFTWTPVGGQVRAWDMTVTGTGEVTATTRPLGDSVGDALSDATCVPAKA